MTSTTTVTMYRITVTGASPFPVDMLRHGQAWPAEEADSSLIAATLRPSLVERSERFEVHLVALKTPEGARWASFGWRVEEVL